MWPYDVTRSGNAVVTLAPTWVAGGAKYPDVNGFRNEAPGGGVLGEGGYVPRLTPVDVR
jgi:hypothetical protein